jgi:hypothetical protein
VALFYLEASQGESQMREGMITVPEFDNDGKSLDWLVDGVMTVLAGKFGGATSVRASGCWIGPDGKPYREPVVQIITAYEPSEEGDAFLRNTAQRTGEVGKQLAMYVRYASGTVEILTITAKAKAA